MGDWWLTNTPERAKRSRRNKHIWAALQAGVEPIDLHSEEILWSINELKILTGFPKKFLLEILGEPDAERPVIVDGTPKSRKHYWRNDTILERMKANQVKLSMRVQNSILRQKRNGQT
jgi:hypothetical protein